MLKSRPLIVTVLGHVDHGKTSLLDVIRKADVAAHEHGGITQHIGAYQIEVALKNTKQRLTIIDTPGHAAFIKMRARGAQVTDLVVLVIAANDGVMPQTKESIEHIKAAGVPFLIALNKIDLPEADPEKVKTQLSEAGVFVEGYGGETVAVPVSAKTGQGIGQLLEMITLLGEMLDPKADPEGALEGVIIESRLDSRRGPTATILVKNGTLRVGDNLRVDAVSGKVRAMFGPDYQPVSEALPSTPVEVLGLPSVPVVGAKVEPLLPPSGEAKNAESPSAASPQTPKVDSDEKKIRIILKADASGSLEVLTASLGNDAQILSGGVGEITESDVLLAKATNSLVYGFNVKIPASVQKLADEEAIAIKTFRIIYEFIEDFHKKALLLRNPSLGEQVLGRASILAEFKIEGSRIAGCRVTEGKISKNDTLHLVREEAILGDVRLKSFKIKKEDILEAKVNEEFGAVFSPYLDFKIGDVLVSFAKLEGS